MTWKRTKAGFSKSVGPYGARVRLEVTRSGVIYAYATDPETKKEKGWSLRHRDRDRAEEWAKQESAKMVAGDTALHDPKPTVARVFALYHRHQTPLKSPSEQEADVRRMKMWARFLGVAKDLSKLTLREWRDFILKRKTGAIDAKGNPVPAGDSSDVQ